MKVGTVMFITICPQCKKLQHEYEHATTTQIKLEGMLLLAVSEHAHDSIQSLRPEVDTAWKLRTSLRAAIRDHGAVHVHPTHLGS